jgi:hypothetical protein
MALGIENLKKAVMVGAQLGNLIGKSVGDKGLDLLLDAKSLFEVMPQAKDAFAHMDLMKAELADLDAQERTDLYAEFAKDLKLPQASIEATVEKCLLTACKMHEIYLLWKN